MTRFSSSCAAAAPLVSTTVISAKPGSERPMPSKYDRDADVGDGRPANQQPDAPATGAPAAAPAPERFHLMPGVSPPPQPYEIGEPAVDERAIQASAALRR